MAPVTRRVAKAQGETPRESPTNSPSATKGETLFEEPMALRGKRKSPSNAAAGEGTKSATPRRKKLEVRIREEPASARSPIEVQIPSSAVKTPRPRSSPVPDSQETAASDEANQTFEPLSASKQLEEEATQKLAAQSRLSESGQELTPLPKAARSTRGSSGKKAHGKSTPQSQIQQKEAEPEAEETPRPKVAKSTHVVFGDDDDVDKFVAAAAEKEKDVPVANGGDEDKEEEESDDEAPEAVSTAAAAKETLKSARAAIEAAEQYAASTKRKRQARDNLLKQQAEKRKRTNPTTSGKEDDSSEDEEGDEEEEEERNITSKRQRRTQKLPDMLPAEFLTDSSEDEDDEAALKKMVKRPQKITFETAMQVSRGARGRGSEVVGSTRYRVMAEQGDPRLAPKANKNSRRVKEDSCGEDAPVSRRIRNEGSL